MKQRSVFSSLWRLGLLAALASISPLQAVPPPSDLVTDGVPEVPDSIVQAAKPYWKVEENYFLSWQPKTNAMLINVRGRETRQLEILTSPEGQTTLTTQFPDNITSAAFMPQLGTPIVFAADHFGDEFYQLYSLDPISGTTQLLTDGNSNNTGVICDHTGKQIAFLSTMSGGRYEVIYVMNPRNPDSRRVIFTPETDGWMLEDWAHDGGHILALHLTWDAGYLWSINTTSGETRLVTKTPETQKYYLKAKYTPQDNGIFGLVLGVHGKITIDYLPVTNDGPVRKIPQDVIDALDLEMSPDGIWMAYLNGKEETQMLHIFNTVTGEEEPKIPLTPALFNRLRWTEDGSQLGFNYGSSSAPFQAYSYNIQTHQLSQWTHTDLSGISAAKIKPELIKMHSFDEREISGYLYRPDPQKFPGKRPVMISIHGGPSAEFVPEYLGAYNYYLDNLGVALFFPNVRGSTGFGAEFNQLDNGLKREDSVKDIGAVLDWIATDSRLDSNRIGVQGGSYGGYMTLATLFHYGNRVRCGSDMMGITDFVTLIRHTKQWWLPSARWELGDERVPEMNKFLESISPLNHAAEIHDPLMITAGKNDLRVPASESEQMVKVMRAQNGIIWYILGEEEGHGFHRSSDAEYQFAAEANFFQTYLLPEKRLTPLVPETAAQTAAKLTGTPKPTGPD